MGDSVTTFERMDSRATDTHIMPSHTRDCVLHTASPAAFGSTNASMDDVQLVSNGADLLTQCELCKEDCSAVPCFWLLPFCNRCAANVYAFEPSTTNLQYWSNIAKEIRHNLISYNTRIKYESIIRRNQWPLSSVFSTLSFIYNTKKTKASMKLAIAAAKKFHLTRGWSQPPFDVSVVTSAIQAALRTPVQTPTEPKRSNVFTNNEVRSMFNMLAPSFAQTYARDAAILAIQLFGARRASEVLNLRISDLVQQDNDFRLRIRRSKTDQRGEGLFFMLPHNTAVGINPTIVLQHYIKNVKRSRITNESFLFTTYNQYAKEYTDKALTVKDWNARLAAVLNAAGLPIRTSHALRSTAISLSSVHDVHTVSQVGGWRSMNYYTTYHRTPLSSQAEALANIGSRIVDIHKMHESDGDSNEDE